MFTKEKRYRFLKEWGIFAGVLIFLYATGLHTELAGGMQRLLLMTGLMDANEKVPIEEQISTDYQLHLQDINGENVSLNDLKGQVIFINFWATWCPPCRAEMPEIQALYQEQKKDVVFLMVALDKDFEKAKKFVQKKEFDFPIYQSVSSLPEEFKSRSIPATFVVSTDGKIVFRREGIADYNNVAFRKILEEAK